MPGGLLTSGNLTSSISTAITLARRLVLSLRPLLLFALVALGRHEEGARHREEVAFC